MSKCRCKKQILNKSQKETIQKAGKIVYKGNLPAIGVIVTNERTQEKAITNKFGIFGISGYDSDIINISTVLITEPLRLKLSELKVKTQLKDRDIKGTELHKSKNSSAILLAIAGFLALATLTKNKKHKEAKKVKV